MSKRALVTGIAGQDGSYLAEHLLQRGYDVHGLLHSGGPENVTASMPDVKLIRGDLLDQASLLSAIDSVQPEEVYNLAAISFVPLSFTQPELTANVNGLGVLRLLEAIRQVSGIRSGSGQSNLDGIRFYQASSSEMFGNTRQTPQNEVTPFNPQSPYGVAKIYGHHITQNYRESYGFFAVSGICFNHESERRDRQFITRKVTYSAARIKLGLDTKLRVGNLDAMRDWGFAGDYVRAMHLMLQTDEPEDYVIGTGEAHSVRDLIESAFSYVGLNWEQHVDVDPRLVRFPEIDLLVADASKAQRQLDWSPTVTFEELIQGMLESDLKLVSDELKR